jgi:uncharacterized protein (TIGR02246 family)
MANTTLTNELIDLENQYWKAIQEKDTDAAMRLTDDECIVTGAQGVGRLDRKALSAMLQQAPYTLHSFELKDPEVRQLGDDVAVVAYKVHEELTVDGKPVKLEAADASTWIRRDGGWRCALHTESISGDPFGRDRQAQPRVVEEQGAVEEQTQKIDAIVGDEVLGYQGSGRGEHSGQKAARDDRHRNDLGDRLADNRPEQVN